MIDQGFAETCQVFGRGLFRGDLFYAGSPHRDTKVLRESSRAIFTKSAQADSVYTCPK